MKAELVFARDVIDNKLKFFDVIIFPGGSGDAQAKSLGATGRANVKTFLRTGGAYIGLCAGSYLAQNSNSYKELSLRLTSAYLYNGTKHWDRGGAIAKVRLLAKSRKYFREFAGLEKIHLFYYQGPLLCAKTGSSKQYTELMQYASNIYPKIPKAKGESPGKTFLLQEPYGKGKIVLMAGHPEMTPGKYWMIPRLIRIATDQKIISYPKRFVRSKYRREKIFSLRWEKLEKHYVSILDRKTPWWKKLRAMRKLQQMRSFAVVEYFFKMLAHPRSKVKVKTLQLIRYYDFFYAVPYIERIYRKQASRWVKREMRKTLRYLKVQR